MTTRKQIQFKIDHIDPLGQGVFKDGDQVYFIPKTLPNETGTAIVLKSKKNINFCRLLELEYTVPARNEPQCPHFHECSGCHYLHTNYNREIEFKKNTFQRMLRDIEFESIDIIRSPERLHYRNRIQLQVRNKKIGFFRPHSKNITEVPNCQIFMKELQNDFDTIYQDRPRANSHIELYYKDNNVIINKDKSYASTGFTQVNSEVNELMKNKIKELCKDKNDLDVLDLFAGDGNLSDLLNYKSRICMDIYPKDHKEFLSVDLYKKDSIHKLKETKFDLLILDPPRSGLKELNEWIKKYRPKEIIYVSCHPMTMLRDIRNIDSKFKVQNIVMIDLFPSTFHFEGLIHLKIE